MGRDFVESSREIERELEKRERRDEKKRRSRDLRILQLISSLIFVD